LLASAHVGLPAAYRSVEGFQLGSAAELDSAAA
jgi:hypothetical protein